MATNAHTEVPGHKAPFPPFQKETFVSQLVWFVIAFIALYVLIKKLAIPQIGGIIEARTGKIEGDLAEAARLKDQSDAALIAAQKLRIAMLERQVYGQRSERAARLIDQLSLTFEELATSATEDELAAEQAVARTTISGFTRANPNARFRTDS